MHVAERSRSSSTIVVVLTLHSLHSVRPLSMLRKLLLVLSVMLATELAGQTIIFTPTSTIINTVNGGNLTFTATVTYSTPPSVLAFSASLPTGWSYVSTGGANPPSITPSVGATSTTTSPFSWSYVTTPASPVTFNFTVAYPAGVAGVQPLASSTITRDSAGAAAVATTGPAFSLAVPSNTATWSANTTDSWTAAGRWSGEVVPNNGTPPNATYAASISSGNVTVSSSIAINDLLFLGGTINGPGSLTIAGSGSDWEAGVFSSLNQLTVNAGAFLTAGGTATHDFGGTTITNNGQFIWNGSGDLRSGNNGAFYNASGATFTDASSGSPVRITNTGIGGSFTFSNAGTYVKTGSTETKVDIPFTNQGTILVNAGNLHFDSTFTQSAGSIVLSSGSTAQFDNPVTFTSGSVNGSGTISGNVTNGAATGATALLSPGAVLGQLAITGNLTLLNTSNLLFDIGGTTKGVTYDFLSVSGVAALGGTLSLTLQNNFRVSALPTDTFTLLTAGSPLTGTFSNIASGSRLLTTDGSSSFLVSYTGNSLVASNFQVVPIPEPSTWALLTVGLGTLGIAALRRRARK